MKEKDDFRYSRPCERSECFKSYGDVFMKCFTHDIKFDQRLRIWDMFITFDENIKQIVKTKSVRFYIHHPGQLFRTGLYPVVSQRKLENLTSLRLDIKSLTVLRERKDGKIYCNSASSDDDKSILENEAKKIKCASIYSGKCIHHYIDFCQAQSSPS